ncbi:class III lanthionine synthetase LanKC [Actinacidiphila sp. ITFR-21]|uniref:class III lanthionine synthetase LanKC n=1 Tax=Actinacidiphila sp. ITFR-21 TaxID=3075199 RepID=UPI00288B890F|nr:class III lanthionine synthetase LanKC [Streptomyces sp. ITFR-21]WNI16174.1 class III lanthionine synthetase LanKC [Streptomyces sp. ITFR-21]
MFDIRYLLHVREHSPFYEPPELAPTDRDFALAQAEPPPGWERRGDHEWVLLTPRGCELPAQGWKVHVSATPDNSARVLATVRDHCVANGLPFKFVRSPDVLLRRNSKYGDRSASGKFVTLYPSGEDALGPVLHRLGDLLDGEPGPYILSDLRWRQGPLYVRYGGFTMIEGRGPDGERVPCLVDPEGRLVPDERRPGFHPPAWATPPALLDEALAARRRGTLRDFPYRVHRALHFSNGGGVYAATDTRTGREVLLKEARPLAGLDAEGRDAVERLGRERWAMETLAGAEGVPEVLDVRVGHEHHYLARAFVDGRPLGELVAARNPLCRAAPADPGESAAYAQWALGVLGAVERGLAAFHERGVVFGDLHPGNLLVAEDDTVHFIDFEAARPVDESAHQAMAAPGFTAPRDLTGTAVDWYAFGCVALSVFLPHTILTAWGEEKTDALISLVTETFPLPDAFLATVRGCLRPAGAADAGPPAPAASAPAASASAASASAASAEPLWPARLDAATWPGVRGRVTAGLLAAATPERADRLWPGDIRQFTEPGAAAGLLHGAAGVLWALSATGADIHPAWADWAATAAERCPGAGFADGLAGIAYGWARAGRREEARALALRAADLPLDALDASLATGSAGIGLTLLDLGLPERAAAAAAHHDAFTTRYTPRRPGLLYGAAGHALFLVRRYAVDPDPDLLERARAALERDVAAWRSAGELWRSVHGIAGPIGTALAIDAYLEQAASAGHSGDATLREARDAFTAAARTRVVPGTGWLTGRSGTLLALHRLAPTDEDRAAVRRHLTDTGWNAVRQDGTGLAFLGEHGLRLSCDLATGAAGVLLAVDTVLTDAPTPLPFLERALPVNGDPAPAGAALPGSGGHRTPPAPRTPSPLPLPSGLSGPSAAEPAGLPDGAVLLASGSPDRSVPVPSGSPDRSVPVPAGLPDGAVLLPSGSPDRSVPVPSGSPDRSVPVPSGSPDRSVPVPSGSPGPSVPVPSGSPDPSAPSAEPPEKQGALTGSRP